MYKNEMKKEIVFFMPSFEGGGVEKNIRIIANYFASKNENFTHNYIKKKKKIYKKNKIYKSSKSYLG